MDLVSSEAIVLKSQDYQERDRLVTFFARDRGRLKGIVKGSRKLTSRGVGSFEALGHGTMYYTAKPSAELVNIRKCDPLPPYFYLLQDYDKIVLAGYFTELIDLCAVPDGEAEALFKLALEGLQAVHDAPQPRHLALLRLRFELKYLQLLGLAPDWRTCCACGAALVPADGPAAGAAPARFAPALGGLLCPRCQTGRGGVAVSAQALAFLEAWRHHAPTGGPARPTRSALAELEDAVTQHLIYQLERKPRSLGLLPDLDALSGRSTPEADAPDA